MIGLKKSIKEETNKITKKVSKQPTGESLLFGNNQDMNPELIDDEFNRNTKKNSMLNVNQDFPENNTKVIDI
jgi:hypothetical protein